MIADYEAACGKIYENAFAGCDINKQDLYDACIFDSCHVGDSEPFVCPTLAQYVSQCNQSPTKSNRIESWRSSDLCPVTCGANSEYLSCTAQSCHGSVKQCEVDDTECELEKGWNCIEGCFCKSGYVLDGTDCVAITPTSCPNWNPLPDPCSFNPCNADQTNAHGCQSFSTTTLGVADSYTCTCVNGFTGDKCEQQDPCFSNPCNADKTNAHGCTALGADYTCNCVNGFSGDNCEFHDPCASNPCNADQTNAHICQVEGNSYKCYCVNGSYGDNCQFARQCTGKSCKGWGDVHYHTFDRPNIWYDNMGFCQYVLTTNVGCAQNWPIDTNNFDWPSWAASAPANQDAFMVVADQEPLPWDRYDIEISRLTGIQIYFSPAGSDSVQRITSTATNAGASTGWTYQVWSAGYGWKKRWCGTACPYTDAAGNFIGSWNRVGSNMAMRVYGNHVYVYLGAGTTNGDRSWYSRNNSPVRDYLLRVQFIQSTYSTVNINANCVLENGVCGVCGDYDNQDDFGRDNNYNGIGNRRVWERTLEKKHNWDMPRLSEGELSSLSSWQGIPTFEDPKKCPFTNQDGNPVPTQQMAAQHNGRKKRQTSSDCPCYVY